MDQSSSPTTYGAVRLPTAFAPAERATDAELLRQHRKLAGIPFVTEFLDAMPNMAVVLNSDRQIVLTNKAFRAFVEAGGDDHAESAHRREIVEAVLIAAIGQRPGEAVGCIHSRETPGGCGTTPFCRHCGAVRAIVNAQKWKELDVQECRLTVGEVHGREASVDFRVWAQPIPVAGEQFTVFSLLDISDEKRRAALERIFFHDVMNTAGGVRSIAELLATSDLGPADQQEAVLVMSQSADQLVEEISAQRALTAAESGDLDVTPRALQSIEVVRRVINVLRRHEVSNGRTIDVAADAAAFTLVSDPVLLRRVLINLLRNALEATPPGGVVTVGTQLEADTAVFTVHNASVMSSEVTMQVFQRSFTTKGTGRGLGTYSIRLLTEHYLQGAVSFTSVDGEGTIFVVRLPRTYASET
jgi:K+-sensing histidine kinase KdpD